MQLKKLGTGAAINTKLNDQTSILQLLERKGIMKKDFVKDLATSIKNLEQVEDYLKVVLPASEFQKGGSMEFLGRYLGASIAPSGTIQVPAQFAKIGQQIFGDIPQTVLKSKLQEAFTPGNIKEFVALLDKASATKYKDQGKLAAEAFVNYIRRGILPSIRLPIQDFSDDDVPPLPKRKPPANAVSIPKEKPPEKKVSEVNIPPRPTITAPPAQEVAQANLGPFNPETLARMEQLDRLVG